MLVEKSVTYDVAKIIATILVVLGHVLRMYSGEGVVTPLNGSEILFCIHDFIYSFHMPLFFCISGMVYGMCINDLNKYSSYDKFLMVKIKRLLTPYIVFGIFYVLPIMKILNFTECSTIQYLFYGIVLSQNPRHLWFLLSLFWIFVFFRTINKIENKINDFLMIFVLLIVSYFSYMVPYLFQFSSAASYLLYFYIGMLINRNYYKIKHVLKNPIILAGLLIFLLLIFRKDMFFLNIISALLGSGTIIGLSFNVGKKIRSSKVFKHIKRNSFGIYLFHPMIIYVIYYLYGNVNINPFIMCGITFGVSFLLSDFMTTIVRTIKLGIIIGE